MLLTSRELSSADHLLHAENRERPLTEEEFLKRVESRFGSQAAVRAWFERQTLPGFNGQTAQQLVAAGRAADVLDLISAVDAGVYS